MLTVVGIDIFYRDCVMSLRLENKAGQEVSPGTLRFLLAAPGLFAAISHKLAFQAQTVLHVCCR